MGLVSLPTLLPGFTSSPSAMVIFVGLSLLGLFAAGYVGAERLWYLRIWRGGTLAPRELIRFSWKFLGRYVALGLIAGIPFFVFSFWLPEQLVLYIFLTLLYDLSLTFATPAAAYTTPAAGEALKISFRMAKEHWPVSAFYMFVPSLAALLLLRSIPQESIPWQVMTPLTLLGILANLLFKGATAAFYLRHHPEVPDDGAVYLRPTRPEPAPKTTSL